MGASSRDLLRCFASSSSLPLLPLLLLLAPHKVLSLLAAPSSHSPSRRAAVITIVHCSPCHLGGSGCALAQICFERDRNFDCKQNIRCTRARSRKMSSFFAQATHFSILILLVLAILDCTCRAASHFRFDEATGFIFAVRDGLQSGDPLVYRVASVSTSIDFRSEL
jgi:hypothetical protein